MATRTLLLCRDPQALSILHRQLERVGSMVDICHSADTASERLARNKYEAVVVDCDGLRGAHDILERVRTAPSNRRSVVLALVPHPDASAAAFSQGANFVLEKPLLPERAARTLRAACGLMMHERRRYCRLSVDSLVTLSYGSVHREKAVLVNLSQTGMALRSARGLPADVPMLIVFSLPGQEATIEAYARSVWTANKHTGVRLLKLAPMTQKVLDLWLNERMDEQDFGVPPAGSRHVHEGK